MIQTGRRAQRAQVVSLPAPIGGLNARDSIANMPDTDALVLDNLFPSPTSVAIRNGCLAWATGFAAPVYTVACYSPPSGVRQLFAAANDAIYNVTAQGAIGAPVVSGNSTDWWQCTNFSAAGAQYLVMVNGQDYMQIYNGAAWQQVTAASAPIAITGPATNTFVHVNSFQGRLYFIVKNSMQVYFMPAFSVGGAATLLDLSSQTHLGGYLMAMATWTVDTTAGLQQMACFITSEGEVLVYQGNDPTYAASWYQVGAFRVGRPVGRRCVVKIGSDVGVLCADGLFPMSKAMLTDRSQQQDAISDKIRNLINADIANYSANPGWQPILSPMGNKLLVNVPSTTGTYQYVMNTINGSWCRFTGWYANCWELMGDGLYFGGANTVYLADSGSSDNGGNINCVGVQAPSYFGMHCQKQFTMARPVLNTNAAIRPSFQINTDFDLTPPVASTDYVAPEETFWGSPWGSPWSAPNTNYLNWQTVNGVGYTGSPALAFSGKNASCVWSATDVAFIPGGPI